LLANGTELLKMTIKVTTARAEDGGGHFSGHDRKRLE
jgi:hypothetical protein